MVSIQTILSFINIFKGTSKTVHRETERKVSCFIKYFWMRKF